MMRDPRLRLTIFLAASRKNKPGEVVRPLMDQRIERVPDRTKMYLPRATTVKRREAAVTGWNPAVY